MEIKNYPRTLSELSELPSSVTDVWLFESGTARRAEQIALANSGRDIRIHSAYKSLLHNVLEHHLFDKADSACIRYPVVEYDEPLRFRLECYPLQDLFPDVDIMFLPVSHSGVGLPSYQLTVCTADTSTKHVIEAPVKWKDHPSGQRLLVATGWMKYGDGESAPMKNRLRAALRRRLFVPAEHAAEADTTNSATRSVLRSTGNLRHWPIPG